MTKITLVLLLLVFSFGQSDFLSQQKKFERVRKAFDEKEKVVVSNLKEHQLQASGFNLLIVAFKEEKVLELYGKSITDREYRLLKTYPVCALSGELGPKRMHEDLQVPEGYYYINSF